MQVRRANCEAHPCEGSVRASGRAGDFVVTVFNVATIIAVTAVSPGRLIYKSRCCSVPGHEKR
jgi:hypothetical protein